MTEDYMINENGFFFTDINAPGFPDTSYGDLSPPGNPPTQPPEPGTTTLTDGKVTKYEDNDIIMDHFTYAGEKIVSYLETNKSTGKMILFTIVRTPGPALDPVGTNEDYQNFADTGTVGSLSTDISTADIENYDFIETEIASIGPGGELIPA